MDRPSEKYASVTPVRNSGMAVPRKM